MHPRRIQKKRKINFIHPLLTIPIGPNEETFTAIEKMLKKYQPQNM